MPNRGDFFITTLKRAHLEWGTHRHTLSRGLIYGEGYLQIPANIARQLQIFNSNQLGAITDYTCNSADEFLQDVTLKASGCSSAGNIYAKQFQGCGNLKVLGDWFFHINAIIGDRVKITWIDNISIEIERI